MSFVILLIDLIALGLVCVAAFHAIYLARIATKVWLRHAWLAMTGLLGMVIALGVYMTLHRLLSPTFNASTIVDSVINLLGASLIFASIQLSRLTARDLLKMAELEFAAFTDNLTGLPNRRSFDAAFPRQVEIAQRRGQPLAFLSLDIDNFKRVNDEHGHECGDKVLAHLGRLLGSLKRKGDTAYRVGGEEFVILAPHTGLAQGRANAERLRRAIEDSSLILDKHEMPVTVSFGVATLHHEDAGSSLVNRADAALYLAKRTGRNRVCTEDDVAIPAPAAAHP